MRLYLRKVAGGALIPDNEETAELLNKLPLGQVLSGEYTRPRNYKFHKKIMALFQVCFEHFTDQYEWNVQYKGMKVEPSFDMFRKQLTILAGHYTASFDVRGKVRLEAKSLSFANCSEEEAEQIYSDVINAALKQVFKFKVSEKTLREMVDNIIGFA